MASIKGLVGWLVGLLVFNHGYSKKMFFGVSHVGYKCFRAKYLNLTPSVRYCHAFAGL